MTTRTSSPQPHLALPASAPGKVSHEISIPERHDEDTPPVYLSKLFEAISKSVVASMLARNGDLFHLAVLKAYMETFNFLDDPMDMALR
jgi:Sec7-like guanine-nucleotide exchange factor